MEQFTPYKDSQIIELPLSDEMRQRGIVGAARLKTTVFAEDPPYLVYAFRDTGSASTYQQVYRYNQLCAPMFQAFYRSEKTRVTFQERNSRKKFSFASLTKEQAEFFLLSLVTKFRDARASRNLRLYTDETAYDFSSRLGAVLSRNILITEPAFGGPNEALIAFSRSLGRQLGPEIAARRLGGPLDADDEIAILRGKTQEWILRQIDEAEREPQGIRKIRRSPFSWKNHMCVTAEDEDDADDIQARLEQIGRAITIAYLAIRKLESVVCTSYFDSKRFCDRYGLNCVFAYPYFPMFSESYEKTGHFDSLPLGYRLSVCLLFTMAFMKSFAYDLSDIGPEDLMVCKGFVLLPRYERLVFARDRRLRREKRFERSGTTGYLSQPLYDLSAYLSTLRMEIQPGIREDGKISSAEVDAWYKNLRSANKNQFIFDELPEAGNTRFVTPISNDNIEEFAKSLDVAFWLE